MNNEILLILSVIGIYTITLLWFYIFGKKGLYFWLIIATIAANIEVLIVVDAFGLEQTLGNVLFASTFLATDILSEVSSKKDAKKLVNVGILTSITFILITQSWLLYKPSESDFIFESIKNVFSNTPRVMIVGFIVYAIVQSFDVWIYHKIWSFTNKITGNTKKFLWLRNNLSTLISQFINSFLFNIGIFYGSLNFKTIISITFATYIIFIFTSILDTPVIYLARYIYNKKNKIDTM